MNASDLVAELRSMIDYLDRHPDMVVGMGSYLTTHVHTPEELAAFVESVGGWGEVSHKLIGDRGDTVSVEARIGFRILALGQAADLCDRPAPVEPVYSFKQPVSAVAS